MPPHSQCGGERHGGCSSPYLGALGFEASCQDPKGWLAFGLIPPEILARLEFDVLPKDPKGGGGGKRWGSCDLSRPPNSQGWGLSP